MCQLSSAFEMQRGCLRELRRAQRLISAALFATLSLCMPMARATTLARMDVRALAQHSAYVARVRCVQVATVTDANLVWTLSTFELTEPWKGNPPPRFAVRMPGGQAAGLRVTVEGAPRFAAGEDVVLFLTEDRAHHMNIVSWAQGTFRIRKNPRTAVERAVQDTAGLHLLDPHSGARAEGERRQLSLAALRASVARALEETAR